VTRKIFTYATTAAVALALLAGCDTGGGSNTAAPAPSVVPSSPAAPSSSAPSVAPSSPAPATSAPTQPPAAPKPQKLKVGAKGAKVTALQQRLTELGYWNGKADGNFGSVTQQAVYAVQKAAGVGRDGVVGPKTQKALDEGVRPKAKSTSGHIVEINLKRQLLMLVDNGEVTTIFNTATGSNQHYVFEGNTYLAVTPRGHFTVSRQIDGQRDGPLGPLWRPKYFNGGIAVHGAPNVPPYPASHGCARLTNSAINWIWANNKIPLKTKVWVY
jgi:peptidoglycan hydrolase-like protein with peptidoglycan-binding domain